MTAAPPHFRLSTRPEAAPEAVVRGPHVRFTALTSRLLRLEFDPAGRFEDRPSQVFWFREQPVPAFSVTQSDEQIVLTTDALRLVYKPGPAGFTPGSLSITLLASDETWRYGDPDAGNLLGTARTLDMVSGATRLEPGLLSRAGWAVVDDSASFVFTPDGWLAPRHAAAGSLDLYFFGYGHDYKACLRDYARIAGSMPLLPRWVLGNWWSRYWAYTQEELQGLMTDFRAHEVPLSVCIVDMDWHLVDVGEGVNGWTGYTWNRELFPDPDGFIAWLHARGLKTALNLHPALGVRPHEAMYEAMAARVGVDPAGGEPIPFDVTDRAFARAYFELLHHPLEEQGVDFWWIDWQQGRESRLPGLDPLWWLNHYHFLDLGRDGRKRPFIFSRWGGLGNHRYPIGFSGDTHVDWESLAFQPYFTATAANVAYGWWSHDIGGHMFGVEDPELYARWVQFGAFSPILRLHSTNNPFHERRPWGYDAEVFCVTREAMQLRHALIPYLYTMSWRAAETGESPVRPLYHDYPDHEPAYHCPDQVTFGTELIAAPFITPADPDTRLSRAAVWLPPGGWYDFFSGEFCAGDAWRAVYGTLADIPVFAREGALVPLGPRVGWGGVENPPELVLHVFAGADNAFALVEDDGETTAYRDGAFCVTPFAQTWAEPRLALTIGPAEGDLSLVPASRVYRLHVYGVVRPDRVTLEVDGRRIEPTVAYDQEREVLHVSGLTLASTGRARLILETARASLLARRDRTVERCRALLAAFRLNTLVKASVAAHLPALVAGEPGVLDPFAGVMAPAQKRALMEISQGVGVQVTDRGPGGKRAVLWNNEEMPGFACRVASELEPERERVVSVPRFLVVNLSGSQRLQADFFDMTEQDLGA